MPAAPGTGLEPGAWCGANGKRETQPDRGQFG